MPLSWKRKPKPETPQTKKKRQERIDRVAWTLYESRFSHNKEIDKDNIWTTAKKIAKNPLRKALFTCNRPFIKLEKLIWEPILTWADNQALLSLLGVVGNVGLIIAVGMYIGSEKQRRDTEVLTAWQTLTNAHGQPGNGGRIKALEFLNASPRNRWYDYPGANWRRRASCLWICTWPSESLAGIDLSAEAIEPPETNAQEDTSDEKPARTDPRRVYLARVQLPEAELGYANLEGAELGYANLEGAELELANLEGAELGYANLEGAELGYANLEGADLGYANLEWADLGYANLEWAYLGLANLEGAYLGLANLEGAKLWNANLEGADLGLANLEGAILSNANLEWAYLWNANLEGAILSNANLEGADLGYANLEGAHLGYANPEGADLSNANLEGAILSNANLEGAKNFTQQQISQAKLCKTQLPLDISLDSNRDCKELGINPETGLPD